MRYALHCRHNVRRVRLPLREPGLTAFWSLEPCESSTRRDSPNTGDRFDLVTSSGIALHTRELFGKPAFGER
jgi:hypothetical protein